MESSITKPFNNGSEKTSLKFYPGLLGRILDHFQTMNAFKQVDQAYKVN